MQNRDWENAIEQLEIAVENDPENAEAHFLLGKAYGHKARYREMKNEFEKSLQLSETFRPQITAERERHWTDQYNAGIIALDKRDYAKGEKYFKTAILIDSSKHEAHKKLAVCFLNSNQLNNALFVYNRLLEKYPNDSELLISVANLYYSQNKFEQTVATLKKVLKIEPDHRDALANLAITYERLGRMDKAFRAFERAIKANPLDQDLIFLYGVHHYKRENYLKSIQLFQRVLELNPNEFEATSNIGNAYLSMAESLRKKLKKANNGTYTPEEIQNLKNRIILNYKRAIPYLEKALEIRPKDPDLWRNLGVAYTNTDNREKGQQAFLKSEELRLESPQ
ncbi:tetratricopeptide repeat protein [candidate division KSB1 bacterium]|nr:tetratricopeptide repeat protein [candidate division KSB1 bacterium]NIS27503.1 tetratricopeptide repeat protein [candidate division KSB1 bacterium]NIU28221.1 tetratricopeptide repeat protein [candidate division KSB1 bacterium]NIU91101.1 tetratricopeptide repeat protein [candidate division KSB1 bacterium]NIV93512.1 tetratricopeptide repeat protein [candidate division KSB1 bacterium]